MLDPHHVGQVFHLLKNEFQIGLGLVFVGDWFLGTIPWSTITLSLVDLALNVVVLFFLFRRPLKSQLADYRTAAA